MEAKCGRKLERAERYVGYGTHDARDWPNILAMHNLPAWGVSDLTDHYADYRARMGNDLDFEMFVSMTFVRHPFRTEERYIRRRDIPHIRDRRGLLQ